MTIARPTVTVRPGFWVYLAVLAGLGWMLSGSLGLAEGAGRVVYGAVFAVCSVGFLLIHEAGHAVGGAPVGMTWTKLTLAPGRAIVELDTDGQVTNRQRFWSSLAGPIIQGVAAAVVVGVSTALQAPMNPVGFAALLALLEASVNLLLPFPGLDGHQIATSGRALLAGRGSQPHHAGNRGRAIPQAT